MVGRECLVTGVALTLVISSLLAGVLKQGTFCNGLARMVSVFCVVYGVLTTDFVSN